MSDIFADESFGKKKCLETGENDKIHFLPLLDTFGSGNKRKSLETGETTKSV